MDSLSRETLRMIVSEGQPLCVSLYMPTPRSGPETQQSPIRLRNLLKVAEERLVARGLRAPEARSLLAPAERLVGDSEFWRNPGDGLAVFVSGGGMRALRLPLAFEELVLVADRSHIAPLLPLFTGAGRFYVLALSQNAVRLVECGPDGATVAAVEGMPASLEDALKYDEVAKQSQTRTLGGGGGQGGASKGPVVGYGTEINEKDRLLRYFQQVSHALHARLQGEQAPLVLAAVDYLMPIYRDANTYPYLLDGGVVGNPDDASADDLARRARDVVAPHFRQAQADAVDRYRQLAGTGGTASGVEAVVRAAVEGRVDALLVGIGEHRWGSFDPETFAVERHPERRPGSDDLVDVAATQTLFKGGAVYAVATDEIPADAAMVAVLRY